MLPDLPHIHGGGRHSQKTLVSKSFIYGDLRRKVWRARQRKVVYFCSKWGATKGS